MTTTQRPFQKPRVDAGACTLTGPDYTDTAVFEREVERLFRPGWQCAGHAHEAAEPGALVTAEVLGESILVVRGRDGRLRAFYNVCRHRGTRLCAEPRASQLESIRCPYHSWTYALDGRLLVAANMGEVAGFSAAEHGLYPVALAEWQGLVFVNLDGQAHPFLDEYPMLAGRFDDWTIADLREGHRIEYDVQANWKQICENYSECYHCPPVHPQLARLSPASSGRNDLDEGPVLGGYSTFQPGVQTLTMTGQTSRTPLKTLPAPELGRVYFYVIFPNLLLSLHPDYVMTHILWPIDAGRTRITCSWLFDAEAAAAPGFDPSDAVEFWDLTNRQDWEMCERTQLGTRSRAYTPGPYSNAEGLLDAFDREYRRRMHRLVDDRQTE
jgi:Rieske 2Fe-2S family protein